MQRLITLPGSMVPHFHQLEHKDRGQWFCCADPAENKVGSGGGTAHILDAAFRNSGFKGKFSNWLRSEKRLVIHAGGESRRLPAYAPFGKSLLPLPVFRWSKGQHLDQKLLQFQATYYERVLKDAPGSYCTLIGSGDVMFISSERFTDIPEADVVVFGIWVDDTVASRHGVFFSHREAHQELAFVRQKPSLQELRDFAHDYFYLMDSGMVLMNHKATMKLMKKSGWDETGEKFTSGIPEFYDLYSDMLTAFGSESGTSAGSERDKVDPELKDLNVKLVSLHHVEFYHFGSNSDLIGSTLKLQNRVADQRLRLTRENDHHPSIFQQNSKVSYSFNENNHHIWIENSCIPGTWRLNHHHILTGIPLNEWNLEIGDHICVDVVPVLRDRYALRIYGYSDRFREVSLQWMGQALEEWLNQRSITPDEAGIDMSDSLFEIPLFPVTDLDGIPSLIAFMVGGGGNRNEWLLSRRLSARDLAELAEPDRVYSKRENMKAGALPKLAANHHKSIFYFLDLERTAMDYRRLGLELPAELPDNEPVIKRINDSMFRARVTGNNDQGAQYEQRAFAILREAMISTLLSEPVQPRRDLLDDQILWGRSPVRLDLAGGWTDTPPYCIMEGGKVVNISVELNGQLPLQVYARPLEEHKIVLRSIDLGQKLEIGSFEELYGYDRIGGGFSIPMAALVLAGFGERFSGKEYPSLVTQLEEFGCGIEISLLSAIPKGSGLGTSSNLAATVLGTLSEFCALKWDRHEIAYRTLILEQMLTTGGGWQDQFGGIFNGVKLLETEPGIRQAPHIRWLPDQLFSGHGTRDMMLLYYTGVTRVARDILGEIVKAMFLNSSSHLEIFSEMKQHTMETFDTLLRNDYDGIAEKVAISWEMNQRLDEGTNPPVIREIIGRIDDYLLGYKLLGAGGGGYLLMFAKTTEAAVRVKSLLESDPPNNRARFVDFNVSPTGFQVSRS